MWNTSQYPYFYTLLVHHDFFAVTKIKEFCGMDKIDSFSTSGNKAIVNYEGEPTESFSLHFEASQTGKCKFTFYFVSSSNVTSSTLDLCDNIL